MRNSRRESILHAREHWMHVQTGGHTARRTTSSSLPSGAGGVGRALRATVSVPLTRSGMCSALCAQSVGVCSGRVGFMTWMACRIATLTFMRSAGRFVLRASSWGGVGCVCVWV